MACGPAAIGPGPELAVGMGYCAIPALGLAGLIIPTLFELSVNQMFVSGPAPVATPWGPPPPALSKRRDSRSPSTGAHRPRLPTRSLRRPPRESCTAPVLAVCHRGMSLVMVIRPPGLL